MKTYIRKIECSNGWIVFSIQGHHVTQVHSTGLVTTGTDDRATDSDLARELERDAINNELHSQQPGKSGVRWPEED